MISKMAALCCLIKGYRMNWGSVFSSERTYFISSSTWPLWWHCRSLFKRPGRALKPLPGLSLGQPLAIQCSSPSDLLRSQLGPHDCLESPSSSHEVNARSGYVFSGNHGQTVITAPTGHLDHLLKRGFHSSTEEEVELNSGKEGQSSRAVAGY